ncbi:MFS general substrate transporter [Ganoderma sinense ZZ0214-1]|uniref:MFS general substrate transporter n=1 Tax=Ganoderma sinense ZZ0214-1 TaxID=1077348 RepID=A0A2G8STE2_9APHY|nr:MFS general substrate transporter [Ganoderma sinense ZZ0214-1]
MSTAEELRQHERKLTRRVLWKLDIHVLPPLAFLWLANFIDRTNIGNARIAGLEQDTHLKGKEFNTALAVFYVSYILVELPSNWVLKQFKPSRWLPFLVTLWGTVTTLSGLVQNYSGLLAIRFFLGLCEGGLLPGIMLYLSTLYRPHELQQRVGIFYASASLSGAFGGLLATAIIKMDGISGQSGWRWIFILEGIATVVIALTSMLFLPADIQSAKFFTDEEREFAVNRLCTSFGVTATGPHSRRSQSAMSECADPEKPNETMLEVHMPQLAVEDEQFEWGEVLRGVKDPQVWMTAVAYMGIIVSFNILVSSIVLILCPGPLSFRDLDTPEVKHSCTQASGPACGLLYKYLIYASGYILAIAAKNNVQRYAAVFLMATGIYPCGPCILSILPNNSAGHYKKATTVALQLAVANCGGFVATFIYDSSQAPTYARGHSVTLGFVCLAWLAMFCNVMYCVWENKARAEGRRQDNLRKYQELWDSGKTRAPIGDRHPDFRFTL